MIIIQDVLVSDEIIKRQFMCNLEACKGACCVEGDTGAPLDKEEIPILNEIYETVKPYLTEEGIKAIEKLGVAVYYDSAEEYGTSLIDNGPCSFISYKDGVAFCGIEQAYYDGKIDYKKPISCHLYPIRIEENKAANFSAMNYDEWDICHAACQWGRDNQIPVYQFLKEPIVRKYGEDFYKELDAAAQHLSKQ